MPRKCASNKGQGDRPKRWELALERQALRNDWPIPQDKKQKILNRCLSFVGKRNVSERTELGFIRAITLFSRLSAVQQRIDLQREVFTGSSGETTSLKDLVAAAEARAEARKRERDGTVLRIPHCDSRSGPTDGGTEPGTVGPGPGACF